MNIDPQFPWWIIANALGGIASAIAVGACKPVARFIARWRASKLPDKEYAERTREELEGLIAEFTAMERAQIAMKLLLDGSALSREVVPNVCKSSGAVLSDLIRRDAVFRYICAKAYIRHESLTKLKRPPGLTHPFIPVMLYMTILHPRSLFQLARAPKREPQDDEVSLPLIIKVVELKMRLNPQHYRLSTDLAAKIQEKFGDCGSVTP